MIDQEPSKQDEVRNSESKTKDGKVNHQSKTKEGKGKVVGLSSVNSGFAPCFTKELYLCAIAIEL